MAPKVDPLFVRRSSLEHTIGADLFKIIARSLIPLRLLIDVLKIVEVILAIDNASVELT